MKLISAALPVPLLLGLIAFAGASLMVQSAQANPASAPPQYTFKTNVNRVLVDVVVTDAHGQPVHGLTKNEAAPPAGKTPQTKFRMEQRLDAPAGAQFLRVAVRHILTGKTGAMEIPLPLAVK
jgi:hypothetical protein